eukprot:m51a1_g7337 hypothetical protein (357) ;mRNA; f:194391-195700
MADALSDSGISYSSSDKHYRNGLGAYIGVAVFFAAFLCGIALFASGCIKCPKRLMKSRGCRWFGWGELRHGQPARSCIGTALGDTALLCTRIITVLWALAIWAEALREYETDDDNRWRPITRHPIWTWFMYNTNWGYFTLMTYFTASIAYMVWYRFGAGRRTHERAEPNVVEYWLWVMFELASSAALSVAVLYWVFIIALGCAAKHEACGITVYSVHAHGVNNLWILVELSLNSMHFSPLHCVFPGLFICLWMVITAILYAATGIFVYDTQDAEKSGKLFAIGFYPLFLVFYLLFFWVWFGIDRATIHLYKSRLAYKEGAQETPSAKNVPLELEVDPKQRGSGGPMSIPNDTVPVV